MGRKAKGIRAERELVQMFWESEWAATRVAGSGNTKLPSTDIIAGKEGRTLAIECRTVNNDRIYIDNEKIQGMMEFTKKSGYEVWFAIKFNRKGWFFLPTHKMKNYLNLEHLNQNA
ncbi:MAG: Holliday junction resolvase Hjc, partial [Candidatus Nanoarchaeia archaeon]|nr:Holliday junction resolvase Hjc [Candidatus Nanoarchaeia archaeon]